MTEDSSMTGGDDKEFGISKVREEVKEGKKHVYNLNYR